MGASNDLAGESARTRAPRTHTGLIAIAGVAVVAALAAGGWYLFGGSGAPVTTASATPTPSPTPSPTVPQGQTAAVTWNPAADIEAALASAPMPQCGDAFAPAETTIANVRAVAQAAFDTTIQTDAGGDGPQLTIAPQFVSTDGQQRSLIASFGGYVVTLDGTVVAVAPATANNVDLFTTGTASTHVTPVFSWDSCGAQQDWPAGTYSVYAVSPVLFGDQLAAAQAALDLGVGSVATLRTDIGNTPLGEDERIAVYCYGDIGSRVCPVDDELLNDVLTFTIDQTTIDDTPAGVAISAPTVVVVP